MASRSPTIEGFRVLFRRPSLGFAEIAWRWTIGVAATALAIFAFLQYLDTLPVTRSELLLLRTRQPYLISEAMARIFRGSAPRAVAAGTVLAITLSAAWILLGSLGRAATLNALVAYFRDTFAESKLPIQTRSVRPLMGLHFFRVVLALAALVGCFGAILLAGLASPKANPAPGSALLIFFMMIMLVGLAWSVVNWFLSLASVFAVDRGCDTFGSVAAAVNLCRLRTGSVLAAGTWFGVAHVVAFFVASSVVAFPLAFAGVLPGGIVFGGVLLITLLYFALVDFLHIGRLAAFVAILEMPPPAAVPAAPSPVSSPPAVKVQLATSIDRDEGILSDVRADAAQKGTGLYASTTPDGVDRNEPILSDVDSPPERPS